MTTTATTLSQNLLRNSYVDNVFHGVQEPHEGKEFYTESNNLFRQTGLNLRKFASSASSSSELNKFFEAEEGEEVPQMQKLLGIQWNTSEDKLSLILPQKLSKEGMWTKRSFE
ncbi:hypothetical protein V3C99_018483 [Haemonchus contortus]|uniref:Uncharacterized protein n=1 Tax=Haemonchus contortus TaxID=6289 RepID=A0A7I5EE73_HAECO